MKKKMLVGVVCMFALLLLDVFAATAADKKAAKGAMPEVSLTADGERLLSKYSEMLSTLRSEITKVVPEIDDQKKSALQEARDAVKKATAEANTAQQGLSKVKGAEALVGHAKGKWIGGADKGIAAAEAALKKATTEAEREAAKKTLAGWQANKEAGLKALKERQEALDKAKIDEAKLFQANQAAQAALVRAQSNEMMAAKAILTAVAPFLSSDNLDAKLVKCTVLAEATPQGMAEFAQQGKEQEALVEKHLADTVLLKKMLEAGGADGGRYGQALKIYAAIQQASPKAGEDLFQRLALAVSLEHAVPVRQSNPKAETNAPAFVDPVKRYLHYEKAFLNGELDPAFKDMTAWDYRNAVNGEEPDEMLAWGREMLRNYRPDHILNPSHGWRYSAVVRTDVRYGSQNVKNDLPALHNYQNIIRNGGICGRRAFFGRFILRCFGIPTVARPQTGHAALARWTPQGWAINLGGGWGAGRVNNEPDTNFLLTTQARKVPAAYLEVQRARWVATVLGEQKVDKNKKSPGFWGDLANFKAKLIAVEAKSVQLAALGAELGEANESAETKAMAVAKANVTDEDKKIVIAPDGVITIPAAACGGGNHLVKSFLGGQQMIAGKTISFEVDVPSAGKYALAARVVTVHDEQHLQLTLNDVKDSIDVLIPYTCGLWEKTRPAEVMLAKGKNKLSFSKPASSFALKDFTLTPAK